MTEFSGKQAFSWPVRVYYEDTDAQGLVYFANYFKFMERARSEWIRALGIDQDAMLRDQRRCFVVVETSAAFVRPARFNDQLFASVRVTERSKATFSMEQNIYRNSLDEELLCRGVTKAAFINADTHKPMRLPEALFEDTKL